MTEKKPIVRRDATGHLNPKYQRRLLEESGHSPDQDSKAFLDGPRADDEFAEELGEAFLESATSGEDAEAERHDRLVSEEVGGPFVTSTAAEEFAGGSDESNIPEATREPLPKTSRADP